MSHARGNREPAIVPAVFANRDAAAVGIDALRRFGIDDADIGVAVADPGRYQHREPSDREVVTAVGKGAGIGGAIGSISGITLVSVSVGEVVAVGGGLLAVASGGLIWGAVIGGLLGVITRVRRRPEEDRWFEVPLNGDQVLVLARVRDWSQEAKIAALFEEAGALAVLYQLDRDTDWRTLERQHPSGQPVPSTP